MVKIEKLSADAHVVFERNGQTQRVIMPGQTLSLDELDSLRVKSGRVVYSINEQELVVRTAETVAQEIADAVVVPATIAPVLEPATTKPTKKIVYPPSKKK